MRLKTGVFDQYLERHTRGELPTVLCRCVLQDMLRPQQQLEITASTAHKLWGHILRFGTDRFDLVPELQYTFWNVYYKPSSAEMQMLEVSCITLMPPSLRHRRRRFLLACVATVSCVSAKHSLWEPLLISLLSLANILGGCTSCKACVRGTNRSVMAA